MSHVRERANIALAPRRHSAGAHSTVNNFGDLVWVPAECRLGARTTVTLTADIAFLQTRG
jgi:hypothetical protein